MEKQKPKWYRESMRRNAEKDSLALLDEIMKLYLDDEWNDLIDNRHEFLIEYKRLKKIRNADISECADE